VVVDRNDAGGFLSAMLQRIEPQMYDRCRAGDTLNAEYATHVSAAHGRRSVSGQCIIGNGHARHD
jgi:hypothetical protein